MFVQSELTSDSIQTQFNRTNNQMTSQSNRSKKSIHQLEFFVNTDKLDYSIQHIFSQQFESTDCERRRNQTEKICNFNKILTPSFQQEFVQEEIKQGGDLLIQNQSMTFKESFKKHCDPIKIISGTLFLAIATTVIIFCMFYKNQFLIALKEFILWVDNNEGLGIFLFLISYIIAIIVLVPSTLFNVMGAYVFGNVFGKFEGYFVIIAVCFVCDTIGGYCAFLISRSLFYDCLKPYLNNYQYLRAADNGVSNNGFKLMFLLRLCPIIPYNVFNYLIALTSVKKEHFFYGSIGMLPHLFLTCYLSIQLTDISEMLEGTYHFGILEIISLIFGIGIVFAVMYLIVYYTKKELNKQLKMRRSLLMIEEFQEEVKEEKEIYLQPKFQM